MRAADLGYAARFQALFLARGWFRQNGVISSLPSAGIPHASRSDAYNVEITDYH
jgi:hypothetical protein